VNQKIASVSLLVKDYDEALEFYIKKLNFKLVEDTLLELDKRWVLIAPKGATETCLLLSKATTKRQLKSVGDQNGGKVFLILHTDDFWRDYKAMKLHNIKFLEKPRDEQYGIVAVFEDLYGNKWDLLQLKE